MKPRLTVAVGVALFGQLLPSAAAASATHATESTGGAFGARWQTDLIALTVEPSYDQLGEGAVDALVLAVAAWQDGHADLPTVIVKRGAASKVGYDPTRPNFNTVRFAPHGDPLADGALAITVITFDTTRGRVLDADIIVNGEHRFDLLDDGDEFAARHSIYDLQNVLTHEFGHLLGLGEEYEDERATMYAYSLPGETHKRKLTNQDGNRVASLYDPSALPPVDPDRELVAQLLEHTARRSLWALAALGAVAFAWSVRRRALRTAMAFAFAGSAAAVLPLVPYLSIDTSKAIAALDVARTVVGSRSHWDGGLIVTHLRLEAKPGAHPSSETLTVLGGQVGTIRQVVGKALPPPVGSKVRVGSSQSGGPHVWVARGADERLVALEPVAAIPRH